MEHSLLLFKYYICNVKKLQNISEILPKHLAWDMDTDTLDFNKDRDIIIPRALLATTPATFLHDISNLEQVYTKTQIVKELKSTKERISNKVCVLVSQRYQVPIFARFK